MELWNSAWTLQSPADGRLKMEKVIVLKGRPAYGGIAKGTAMCCPNSIQGWAGVEAMTGKIIEKGHVHEGESFDGKILVLPTSKGSCGWSGLFQGPLDLAGIRPAGWVVKYADSKVGVAAVITDRPMVCDFEEDIFEFIKDGDMVEVNGDTGEVTIRRDVQD